MAQPEDPGSPRDDQTAAGGEADATDDPSMSDLLRANFSDRNSVIDSSLPTVAFLGAYLATSSSLRPALLAAVASGMLIAGWRLFRGQTLRHVAGGFFGVLIAALVASRTGKAEDFFLPGLLLNLGYAAAFAISALLRAPLVGLGIRAFTGDGGAWRDFPPLRKAAYQATWAWAGLFAARVIVQVPLYLAGAVGALGVAKLAMGFPLFLLGLFLTHRILSPALAQRRAAEVQPQ